MYYYYNYKVYFVLMKDIEVNKTECCKMNDGGTGIAMVTVARRHSHSPRPLTDQRRRDHH